MKRILLSLLTVGAVGTLAFGASQAFFSDTETSTGNTFTAGKLDLRVDSNCTYLGQPSHECGTWELKDLNPVSDKFFNFTDIKPGDYGENTISLHVYNNDAWGRLIIDNLLDDDVDITEPEDEVATGPGDNNDGTPDGDLRENLRFWVWLDQGGIPGFQCPEDEPGCGADLLEGDNILQEPFELPLISPGTVEEGETWYLADGLSTAYGLYGCAIAPCPGLESDGHMVGSITYYFGIGWGLPSDVGNIVQSDSFSGDMTLEVVQYRNNPAPPVWP